MTVLPTEGIRFHVLIHFCNCTCNVEFNYHSFNLLEVYQLSAIFLVTINFSVYCLNYNAPYPLSVSVEPMYGG